MGIFDRLGRIFGSEPARPPAAAPAAPPPPTFDYADERIPDSARASIARILESIAAAEKAMDREAIPSFNRVDTDQMRDIHLPKLVQSYIDIPADHRGEIFRKTGKSASFLLNQSLATMQAKIDTILKGLAQQDIDTFTNNTQFIGERYSGDEDPFR